ncbi:MAG: hypothetical protein M1823_001687 [Watsoniomyces obsoletus]|nr:MAG: hypothetical protein M1823_001687 [Watsoniomyces obsoletus]
MKRPPAKDSKSASGNNVSNTTAAAGSTAVKSSTTNGVADPTAPSAVATTSVPPESDTVLCKHCKKQVSTPTHPAHTKACLKEKQERLRKKREAKEAKDAAAAREKEAKEAAEKEKAANGGNEAKSPAAESTTIVTEAPTEKVKGAKKSAAKASAAGGEGAPKNTKKRKAEADAEKAPKPKKKKEEPKPKLPKPKGPVDVEKHCGVILPNGAQCARSLTCKSHSMGAKRAVLGRSLPYDMLLHAYQKKNQAKQQKAALDANAPLQDEHESNAGPIDSDEEKDAVMAGIARSNPQPLVQPILMPRRGKYQYMRMKEMLQNAMGGIRGQGLFAVGDSGAAGPAGRASISVPDGETVGRRNNTG